jgi:hypothetical protein
MKITVHAFLRAEVSKKSLTRQVPTETRVKSPSNVTGAIR